nr:hypothetical protein [Enterococcus sp. 665A]
MLAIFFFASVATVGFIFPQKTIYAENIKYELRNDDIQVMVEEESSTSQVVKLLKAGDAISMIQVGLTAEAKEKLADKRNEIEQLDLDEQKNLTLKFDEEVTSTCVEYISYFKGGKKFRLDSSNTIPSTEEVAQTNDLQSEQSSNTSEEQSTEQTTSSSSDNSSDEISQDNSSNEAMEPRAGDLGKGSPEIPEGGQLINGLFDSPVGGIGFNVKPIMPSGTINNGMPYHEITVQGKNNWVAMWSLENNRLDFSKSFKGRMYVNFGTAQADGFTFTIHNDPQKTQALTKARDQGKDGQNLGAYGSSSATTVWGVRKYPNADAIGNSFTVEFDMYTNGNQRFPYSYDVTPSQLPRENVSPHMAFAFPGNLEKTYGPISKSMLGVISDENDWFPLIGSGRAAKTNHYALRYLNNSIGSNVQDGTWYEFNFSFDFPTKTFQYYLRNPVTGNQTNVTSVPWSDLSSELKLSANDSKSYWGFTAANGASEGAVKMVFADVPVPLDYEAKNQIYDSTGQNISVSEDDDSKQKYAKKGDSVRFETVATVKQLDYTSPYLLYEGEVSPDQVDMSTLKESTVKVNDESIGSFVPTTNVNGRFSLYIPKEIKQGDVVEIESTIKSKDDISSDIKDSFSASLITINPAAGSYDYLTGSPTYFWLKNISPSLNVSWSNKEELTTLEKTIDRSALSEGGYALPFYYRGGTANSTLNYTLIKSDGIIEQGTLNNGAATTDTKEKTMTIPTSLIKYGSNTFVLQLTENGSTNAPNQLSFVLNVLGSVQLSKAPTKLNWTNRTIGETKGVMKRDEGNNLDLEVLDSREAPANDWYVSVSIIKSDGSAPFSDVDMIWKDSAGTSTSIPESAPSSGLKIMDKLASVQNGFANQMHLGNDAGVLLKSDKYLSIGKYEAAIKIQWTLNQTYEPE